LDPPFVISEKHVFKILIKLFLPERESDTPGLSVHRFRKIYRHTPHIRVCVE